MPSICQPGLLNNMQTGHTAIAENLGVFTIPYNAYNSAWNGRRNVTHQVGSMRVQNMIHISNAQKSKFQKSSIGLLRRFKEFQTLGFRVV